LQPKERGAHIHRYDPADQILPRVGRQTGAHSLPNQEQKRQGQRQRSVHLWQQQRHNGQAQKGQAFVNGHPQRERFKPFQARDAPSQKQLRKLPSHVVDGRDQTNKNGGTGHGGEKQRQNRREARKANRHAEKRPIQHVEDVVVF